MSGLPVPARRLRCTDHNDVRNLHVSRGGGGINRLSLPAAGAPPGSVVRAVNGAVWARGDVIIAFAVRRVLGRNILVIMKKNYSCRVKM